MSLPDWPLLGEPAQRDHASSKRGRMKAISPSPMQCRRCIGSCHKVGRVRERKRIDTSIGSSFNYEMRGSSSECRLVSCARSGIQCLISGSIYSCRGSVARFPLLVGCEKYRAIFYIAPNHNAHPTLFRLRVVNHFQTTIMSLAAIQASDASTCRVR